MSSKRDHQTDETSDNIIALDQSIKEVRGLVVVGLAVIWDALKGAAESDPQTAKVIFDSAGIVVGPPDLTVCYDERGTSFMAIPKANFHQCLILTTKPCRCV